MAKIKVPTPRQLPSGSWTVQIMVNGQRMSITEETERACIARAMATKEQMLAPLDKSRKPTLSKAIDNYIEARQNILSPSTLRGYRMIQKWRFEDAMSRPIDRYGEKDWQRICNMEARKCSAKTLRNAWGLVSAVIREETGERYTVTLPQITTEGRNFIQPEQIPDFVQAVRGTRGEIPALLALCSLRRSEIMGLTWEDVDLERGVIRVRGAVVTGEDGEFVKKRETKNTTSRRDVPIMIPQLREALERVEDRQGAVAKMHPETMNYWVHKACDTCGIPRVSLHELRHSFASLAYHLRMPAKLTQEIGGWKDDQTMSKIYTHIAKSDVSRFQNEMANFYKISNEITNGNK